MSLYTVSRAASANDCVEAAQCMYYQQVFPSTHMDRETYERIAIEQIEGDPAIIVYSDEYTELGIAWLTFNVAYDLHFPGRGATVYNLVVDKNFPEALPILMREFRRIIREAGCEWYQTTKRVDEFTLTSTFKRLKEAPHGQRS